MRGRRHKPPLSLGFLSIIFVAKIRCRLSFTSGLRVTRFPARSPYDAGDDEDAVDGDEVDDDNDEDEDDDEGEDDDENDKS